MDSMRWEDRLAVQLMVLARRLDPDALVTASPEQVARDLRAAAVEVAARNGASIDEHLRAHLN